jgi:hypothetical protein
LKSLIKSAENHTHNHLKWANLKFNEQMGNDQDSNIDVIFVPPTPDIDKLYETLYTRGLVKGVISSKD